VEYMIEVVTVPVSDVDQALEFYTRLAGNTWTIQEIGYHTDSPHRDEAAR